MAYPDVPNSDAHRQELAAVQSDSWHLAPPRPRVCRQFAKLKEMRSIAFYHFFPLALPLLLPDEDLSLASLESFAFRGSSIRKPTKFFCPNVFK